MQLCIFLKVWNTPQSSKYPETPLNSARGQVFGCLGDVPICAKNTTHTLAGYTAPVCDHASA